jgi:ring-1,2-phenylacetyl-CoA epoxidase subunit PaaD
MLSSPDGSDHLSQQSERTPIQDADVWAALESVKDPEIPVISVVEMGIVRDVLLDGFEATVIITPTFSGCPALHVIIHDIEQAVRELGCNVIVETVIHPAWTSDWISDDGRQKLKEFGLSPPPRHGGRLEITFFQPAPCPYCDSLNSSIRNTFGPTLCRAIYYCNDCQQPFEQFKAL